MNRLSLLGMFCLAMLLILTGCRSNSDVISDRGIQKRKYRSGFYVAKRATATVQEKNESQAIAEVSVDGSDDALVMLPDAIASTEGKTQIAPKESDAKSGLETSDSIQIESSTAKTKSPSQTQLEDSSPSSLNSNEAFKTQPEIQQEAHSKGGGITYSKNTGRVGLILFILGLVFSILSAILFGSFSLSASGATTTGLAVAFSIVGWLMITIGIVMMVVHLMRLILDA